MMGLVDFFNADDCDEILFIPAMKRFIDQIDGGGVDD
jgi:hypothetical protein